MQVTQITILHLANVKLQSSEIPVINYLAILTLKHLRTIISAWNKYATVSWEHGTGCVT
jgi:hypothetical protein